MLGARSAPRPVSGEAAHVRHLLGGAVAVLCGAVLFSGGTERSAPVAPVSPRRPLFCRAVRAGRAERAQIASGEAARKRQNMSASDRERIGAFWLFSAPRMTAVGKFSTKPRTTNDSTKVLHEIPHHERQQKSSPPTDHSNRTETTKSKKKEEISRPGSPVEQFRRSTTSRRRPRTDSRRSRERTRGHSGGVLLSRSARPSARPSRCR
jgi:hypothetical protein